MVARTLDAEVRGFPLEVGGVTLSHDAPGFAEAIMRAYASRHRPKCLCRPEGIEMYIARLGDGYIVKRMPETGSRHAPECPSFEPAAEASGRTALVGTAIREDPATGLTLLRLDFSLNQGSRPSIPIGDQPEASTASSRSPRLSLRGLLHYLWDQAGLARWHPGFAGKRSWAMVRHRLRLASMGHTVGGHELPSRLYIPEAFNADQWDAIRDRRSALWAAVTAAQVGRRPLMLLIAEMKEVGPARHGFKATMKHVPDLSFMLDEALFRQMSRRFERQFALWSASDDIRLLVIGTFGTSHSGVPLLAELSLMPTTRDWLPVESTFERQLITRLVSAERTFVKCLHYNLSSDAGLPTVTLTDCGYPPPLLYITAGPVADSAVAKSLDPVDGHRWHWRPSDDCMPALPPASSHSGHSGRP